MDISVQLDKLLLEKQGYYHWSNILFFFDENKDELSNKDKKRIYIQAEKYRTEHNKKVPEDIITREDTKPNIYINLSYLEENKKLQIPIIEEIEEYQLTGGCVV